MLKLILEFARFHFEPLIFLGESFQLKICPIQLGVNLPTLVGVLDMLIEKLKCPPTLKSFMKLGGMQENRGYVVKCNFIEK